MGTQISTHISACVYNWICAPTYHVQSRCRFANIANTPHQTVVRVNTHHSCTQTMYTHPPTHSRTDDIHKHSPTKNICTYITHLLLVAPTWSRRHGPKAGNTARRFVLRRALRRKGAVFAEHRGGSPRVLGACAVGRAWIGGRIVPAEVGSITELVSSHMRTHVMPLRMPPLTRQKTGCKAKDIIEWYKRLICAQDNCPVQWSVCIQSVRL